MPAITFLGLKYNLDMLDNRLWNNNRLPRVLLFRQVIWKDGHVSSDLHLEAMFMAGISKISESDALYYCGNIAKEDYSNKWTAVTLVWGGDEKTGYEPNILDIIEFFPDGTRIDERVRRHTKVATAHHFRNEREEPVVFAVQVSGHMTFMDEQYAHKIYAHISNRWRDDDLIFIFDPHVHDATHLSREQFIEACKPRGGSMIGSLVSHVRDIGYKNLLIYSTGNVTDEEIDFSDLNVGMVEMKFLENFNRRLQCVVPCIDEI